MTMNRFLLHISVILFLTLPQIGHADPAANSTQSIFSDKVLARPQIYVETAAQFVKWRGKGIGPGKYDPDFYERTRLGTVAFSPSLRVHIDSVANKVHFPSFYELVDSQSGEVLGTYAVFNPEDANWYFSGNGSAYLNQTHLSLCGPRYTRKLAQVGKKLVEVAQPLVYIGAETDVEETTPLFESPSSRKIVATVTPGTKVTVIGLQPGKSDFYEMSLLVRTPFGLTGWHLLRSDMESGKLSIYQCN